VLMCITPRTDVQSYSCTDVLMCDDPPASQKRQQLRGVASSSMTAMDLGVEKLLVLMY
jgi:hypothetical protein